MKYIVIIAAFIMAVAVVASSCDNDDNSGIDVNTNPSTYELTQALDFIPSHLDSFDNAIYVNESQQEIVFDIQRKEIEIRDEHNGKDVVVVTMNYELLNSENGISIIVVADHIRNMLGRRESVHVESNPFLIGSDAYSQVRLYIQNHEIYDGLFSMNYTSIELNNTNFNNVYESWAGRPDLDEYSVVYYNTSLGVVGFKDVKNQLWSLKRYE